MKGMKPMKFFFFMPFMPSMVNGADFGLWNSGG